MIPARAVLLVAASAFLLPPSRIAAQGAGSQQDTVVRVIKPLVVTVTRTPVTLFEAPQPVSVISATRLAESLVHNVPDLFTNVAGLDATGIGAQQVRPVIRGQKGQRILLLQDGMRMNNSRRQQDFGEIPALVDPATIQRVEVVRGPSSVLYGTDAIGGVVNLITTTPQTEGLHGSVGYRFGEREDQHRGVVNVGGRFGPWDLQFDASVRDVGSYTAPAGSFGDITLDDEAEVSDSGVEDRSFSALLGHRFDDARRGWFRVEHYDAEEGGFGFVEPSLYGAGGPEIRIRYPDQQFTKFSAGFSHEEVGIGIADRLEVLAYRQRNDRELSFRLAQMFGPGMGFSVETTNFSDLSTLGFRVEAMKRAGDRVELTYGVDGFLDDSENSDISVERTFGFGPPTEDIDETPQVPNANYRSIGAFGQAEVAIDPRATVILGARLQNFNAESRATPGLDVELFSRSENTVVGAANALYRLTDRVHLVGTVGTAFRSPNLVELFFEGPVPEGSAYQVPNRELTAETSLNVDLGARFQGDDAAIEAFWFRNRLSDAIRIEGTGEEVDGIPAFRNVNVDEVVIRGIEVTGELYLPRGLSIDGGISWLDSDESEDGTNPVGESYATKLHGTFRWTASRGWAEYSVRHQGERDEVSLVENPIGDLIPSFTVHTVRGGVTLLERGPIRQRLTVGVQNLTDELYAEFANAAFFRPAPGRSLLVQLDLIF